MKICDHDPSVDFGKFMKKPKLIISPHPMRWIAGQEFKIDFEFELLKEIKVDYKLRTMIYVGETRLPGVFVDV